MTIIRKYTKPKKRPFGIVQKHRRWIKGLICCVPGCGQGPCDPAHARKDLHAGTSQKTPDLWIIPLCRAHHDEQHRGEVSFERKYKIDMKRTALDFMEASPCRAELKELMREDDHRWIANNITMGAAE